MKKYLFLALMGMALFAGCDSSITENTVANDTVAITSLSLGTSSLTFSGATSKSTAKTITATVVPVFYSEDIVWKTSNAAVATVAEGTLNKYGVVTAVGSGDATISACNSSGTVLATCPVTVALETTAPGTVSGITSTSYGSNVILNWTDPSDSDLDHILVTYDGLTTPFSFSAGKKTGTVSGLTASTSYTFSLTAVDVDGNAGTAVTYSASTTTADTEAPGKVTDLTASNTGVGEVTLTWSSPSDSDYRGVLVQVTSSSSGAVVPASFEVLESAGNSTVVSGLSSGKTYAFRVIARDWDLNQASAAMVAKTTSSSDLMVTSFSGATGYTGQVVLSWYEPVSSEVASFVVTAVGVSSKSIGLGVGQVVFNDLTVGTKYTFTIASVLADGTTMTEVETVTVTPVTVKYLIESAYSTTVYYLNSAYTSTYTSNNDAIISLASEYTAGTSPANCLWTAYPGLADPENPKSISLANAGTLLNGRYLRLNSASPNTAPGTNGQYFSWTLTYIQTAKYYGWVDATDSTDTFNKDATFYVRSANNGTSGNVSFAWYQDTARYLTADAWHVFGRKSNEAINSYSTAFTFAASSSWILLKQ